MPDLRFIVRSIAAAAAGVVCCALAACATGGAGSSAVSSRAEEASPRRDFAARFAPPSWPAPNALRTARGEPGPDYWQQRCDYTIRVSLDEAARSIAGRATITYTNNSPQELPFIWLHLEQNLFRPDSQGAQMTGPGDRFGNRDGFEGGMQIVGVSAEARADGSPDPAGALELHTFDTLARLDLPAPISPRGGTATFTIAWTAKVPNYGSDRLGIDDVRDGPIFQLAQWFPAVAKFDDVHGWGTLPYLGTGEFYTDFGDFEVAIDVPAAHLVAATGELANEDEVLTAQQRERLSAARSSAQTVTIRSIDEITSPDSRPRGDDGRLTWRFRAHNVRTFAWASSAAFAWDACLLPIAGRGSNGGVLCESFYPREGIAHWGKSTQMVRQSIEHYSRMWYPYPYPTATNVNGIVGGMEYPMLAFCRARDDERALWGVTTHELGHNWFPMIVNTDERRHAWMDEGFNTFMNYYASLERDPDTLPRRGHPRRWAREQPKPFTQPVDTPPDLLARGTLGVTQYAKPAAGLVLLREGILGEERFDAAFREYLRRWAFKSPRPWDFARTIEDVAGMDLGWFWRGWFYSTGVLDQAVTSVMQAESGANGEGGNRNARVTIANLGELVMPVTFRVDYTDGTSEKRSLPVQVWAQGDTWTTTWDVQGRRIKSVTIDPDEVMPDVEPRNNVWR